MENNKMKEEETHQERGMRYAQTALRWIVVIVVVLWSIAWL